jgi:hypothetical protein
MLGAPRSIGASTEGALMTYPEPERSPAPVSVDAERRATLLVIAASALSVCGTAAAGLLIVLGRL